MTSLFLEKIAPYVLAVVAVIAWHAFDVKLPAGNEFLSASMTLGAILTGFLATAKAILMSFNSDIMNRIMETDYKNDLVSYLSQAIWLSFAFCITSLFGFFLERDDLFFELAWVFFGVGAGGCFIRVTNIMLKIIKH